jgi:hypothetical protein
MPSKTPLVGLVTNIAETGFALEILVFVGFLLTFSNLVPCVFVADAPVPIDWSPAPRFLGPWSLSPCLPLIGRCDRTEPLGLS